MFNTAALLRTVKSRWRIVRSSVQTVSIANSSYSEHIRTGVSLLHQGTVYARFAVCTILTDQQTVYTLSFHEIFYVLPMRCNFRIVNSSLRTVRFAIRRIRTDRNMAYTDRYSIGQPSPRQHLKKPQRTIKHAQYRKKHTGYDTLELDMLSSWSREGTINFTVASNNATIFSRTDGLWVVGTL